MTSINWCAKMEKTARLLQRVVDLTLENRRLKDILKLNGIDFDLDDSRSGLAQKDGGAHDMMGPVKSAQISVQNYNLFTSMFKGRSDVFSKRSARPDPKTGKCGYYVQKDYSLPNKTNRPLTNRELLNHLKGSKLDCSDVIGIYPMLPDETC